MNIGIGLPLAVGKANLGLFLHGAQLIQQARKQWVEQSTDSVNASIEEIREALDDLQSSDDQAVVQAAGQEAVWRSFNRQLGTLQSATQTALSIQALWMTEWQQSLAQWQREALQPLDHAEAAPPEKAPAKRVRNG